MVYHVTTDGLCSAPTSYGKSLGLATPGGTTHHRGRDPTITKRLKEAEPVMVASVRAKWPPLAKVKPSNITDVFNTISEVKFIDVDIFVHMRVCVCVNRLTNVQINEAVQEQIYTLYTYINEYV